MIDRLRMVSADDVVELGAMLLDAYRRDSQLLIAGNGGSASLASHLACDLGKTTLGTAPDGERRPLRVFSLVDSIPVLTAWANDAGYETIFAQQLRALGRRGDVLLVISGSGNSPNILSALETARVGGLTTCGLLGFDGGRAKALLDRALIVESFDYGQVETAHAMIGHMLTVWLRDALSAG